MKKDELKTGDVVEYSDGQQYLILRCVRGGQHSAQAVSLGEDSKGWDLDWLSDDYKHVYFNSPVDIANNYTPEHPDNPDWTRPAPGRTVTIRGKSYSESTIVEALKQHCPE